MSKNVKRGLEALLRPEDSTGTITKSLTKQHHG